MARATQLGTSSAAANTQPPPSAPAPSPSIARMTDDTTSDLKEIKQTTHASRTQRPRLRGDGNIQCTDPTVDQEHDDHGLENKEATGRSTSRPSAVGHQGRWPLPDRGRGPSTTRPRAVYNEAEGRQQQGRESRSFDYNKATGLRQQRGRGPAATRTARPRACCNQNTRPRAFHKQNSGPSAATASLATARAVHSPRAGKISEERATPDYAAPPQTVVVRKRHWRVSPRRQLQRHSRRQWGADQSQQSRRGSQQPPARQSPVREELPPQSREASCLATDVTGPRATQVPPAKRDAQSPNDASSPTES